MQQVKTYKISNMLQNYILITVFLVAIFSIIGFAFISYHVMENDRKFVSKQINTTFSQILIPSLEISDTAEIKRFLKLVSYEKNFIAVLDKNKNIIISNYNKMDAVQQVMKKQLPNTCQDIRLGMTKITGDYYYISCLPLKETKNYGLILNFDRSNFLSFSKEVAAYSTLLLLTAILVTGGILRNIVRKKLLIPINDLRNEIIQQSSDPTFLEVTHLNHNNECEEINSIKQSFYRLLVSLKEEHIKNADLQSKAALNFLAQRLAHDIRSPLVALNIVLKQLPQIPEKQRILMVNSIKRINDIANNLLQQYKAKDLSVLEKKENNYAWLLSPVVEGIVSEKRLQDDETTTVLETEISEAGFAAFARIDLTEAKRMLSNLVNNSIEAFNNKEGKIVVSLDADEKNVYLKITDNGCGISEEKLEKVTKPGISFKEQGSGIGLSHAKEFTESLGGTLTITSKVNIGTAITITLPKSKTPDWFVSKIVLLNNCIIAILDDDQTVHDAWEHRLSSMNKKLEVHHFKFSKDLKKWYKTQIKPVQLFSDYELIGENETGLDILEQIGAGKNGVLLTSHYENSEIISRCQTQGIRLLPKNLLVHVPIIFG